MIGSQRDFKYDSIPNPSVKFPSYRFERRKFQTKSKPMSEYLYHGTTSENILNIAEHGLLPRGENEAASWREFQDRDRGIYVTERPSAARAYARGRHDEIIYDIGPAPGERARDSYVPFVLRFKNDASLRFSPDILPTGQPVEQSWILTNERIPPDQIDIRIERGRWVPIKDYAEGNY